MATILPMGVRIRFFGTRGSRPVVSSDVAHFGGNTALVVIEAGGEPILLDLGTGLSGYARHLEGRGPLRASALLSHYHFDHVQGLPFFTELDREGVRFTIHAPRVSGDALAGLFRSPYFPVSPFAFRGKVEVVPRDEGHFFLERSGARCLARIVAHTDVAFGFRIEVDGVVITYIPDHQAPDDLVSFAPAALELADGADVLIHDSQYDDVQFAAKGDWGHSTYSYAADLAREAGAKKLVLFHHDPARTDVELFAIEAALRTRYAPKGLEIAAAREGACLLFGAPVRANVADAGPQAAIA